MNPYFQNFIVFESLNLRQFSFFFAGDVDGSIEAINDALATYKSKKIKLNVLSSNVGAVTENDIRLAQTFKGTYM